MTQVAIKSPREYNLPHDTWRRGQYEATQSLLAKPDGSVTILQAPVGSGKTSLVYAMGSGGKKVTALVKTRALQSANYLGTYKFDILYGRGNYPCVHPDRPFADAGADSCIYEGEMDACEYAEQCGYLVQRGKVRRSSHRCLNLAYYLLSGWTRQERWATDYLFIDEAHLISDEVVEHCGMTVREKDRVMYGLPEFPTCYTSDEENSQRVSQWAGKARGILYGKLNALDEKSRDPSVRTRRSKIERFIAKIGVTQAALESCAKDWYVRAGSRVIEVEGRATPGLIVKPLTAKYHFPALFTGVYKRLVLMSATIGNPEIFAEELGIKEKFIYESVPNNFPPERRPVHVPECPVLGFRSPESAWMKQAEIIAGMVKDCPRDWSGVIHIQSWAQATKLAKRLTKFGVDSDRLYVPPRTGGGTNQQLDGWNTAKLSKPGMLVITPSMSEGVDLGQERICIIAKTPWPASPPGSYEAERGEYSQGMLKQRIAWGVEQRCGRTRRGNEGDYDSSFERRGMVGIVDGSFKKSGIRLYCSEDFAQSLVWEKKPGG